MLQGLLDRSPVLHPHPPWQLWTPEGFGSALELVYDASRALVAGEAPDFEAYRTRLNASLVAGSITVGQDPLWLAIERQKEYDRHAHQRGSGQYYLTHWHPDGNPGPGTLAQVAHHARRTSQCTFAWLRERQTEPRGEPIRTTFTCPDDQLLNVSAYTPGDFRIFFDDPRTREEYLQWAPLLLEAEEYHAGNREIEPPAQPAAKKPSSREGQRRYRQLKLRKALIGREVVLKRAITTRGGDRYEAGSHWRVTGGEGGTFTIAPADETRTSSEAFWIRCVEPTDFEVLPEKANE